MLNNAHNIGLVRFSYLIALFKLIFAYVKRAVPFVGAAFNLYKARFDVHVIFDAIRREQAFEIVYFKVVAERIVASRRRRIDAISSRRYPSGELVKRLAVLSFQVAAEKVLGFYAHFTYKIIVYYWRCFYWLFLTH